MINQGDPVPALASVTDDSFDAAVVSNPRPVVVEYWAQWCPPDTQTPNMSDSARATFSMRTSRSVPAIRKAPASNTMSASAASSIWAATGPARAYPPKTTA